MRRFNDGVVRLTALLVLVAATATTVASEWHAGDDDLACIQIVVSSGDGAARTIGTAPAPAGDPRHCVLCHWSRWFRSVPSHRSQVIAPSPHATAFVVLLAVSPRHQAWHLTPGRAPPAGPVLQISFI
jgi:hypothetical protein